MSEKTIDKGTVVRHCKFSTLNDQGKPSSDSFELRPKDDGKLSVRFLDYFDNPSEKERVSAAKKQHKESCNYNYSSGVLAVLDITESQDYVFNKISKRISYIKMGLPHCGIVYPNYSDMAVAELLSQCVKNIYPVKEV
jgi:hypothetical protein